jgi:hypothetical protein
MEKVLQILVVLALLMLAVNYYIKAEKTKFRLYYAAGRTYAPADLLWNGPGMDPDNQLLFLAGDAEAVGATAGNMGTVEVLDSNTGELLTHIPVGMDPGTQVFDPETRLLYSANGDGTVSIVRQVNKNTYKTLQTLITHQGCRLLALDTRTKKIYLPVSGAMPETEGPGLATEGSLVSMEGPISGMNKSLPRMARGGVECWVYSNQ